MKTVYTSNANVNKGRVHVTKEVEYEYSARVPNRGLGCVVFLMFVASMALVAVFIMQYGG